VRALLATCAPDESADQGALHNLLSAATARLGPPEPQDTFTVDVTAISIHIRLDSGEEK
jgi:hypothetical protein